MRSFEQTESEHIELPRPPVAKDTREMLAEDYEQFKIEFLEWLLTEGKDSYQREGYSESTVITTHYKIEETYRWLSERTSYGLYDGRDDLWLTWEGNPYCSQSLKPVLDKLINASSIMERNPNLS